MIERILLEMLNKLNFILLLLFSVSSLASVSNTWTGIDLSSSQTTTISSQSPGKLGLVVVFLSVKCPCSNSHVSELKELAQEFNQFRFLAVHSNSDEPLDLAKTYFAGLQLPFTAIQDTQAKIADELKAFKTPHVYVFGPQGDILYRGGVTSSSNAPTAEHHYLKDVLRDLANGKTPTVKETRTLGCVIAREKDNKNVW